jgi:hypothetical protein
MNRSVITLGVATAFLATLAAAGTVNAATVTRSLYTQASGACQGALPNFENNFRKRPLAVANEGATDAFLTCGVRTTEDTSTANAVELYVTNRNAAAVDVNCTLVDGVFDNTIGFANYYPQTVTATAGVDSAFSWSGFGSPWQQISCNVPAKIEVNMVYSSVDEDVGT